MILRLTVFAQSHRKRNRTMINRLIISLLVVCLIAPMTAFAGTCCPAGESTLSLTQEACCPMTTCAIANEGCAVEQHSLSVIATSQLRRVVRTDFPQHPATLDVLDRRVGKAERVLSPPHQLTVVSSPQTISLPLRL